MFELGIGMHMMRRLQRIRKRLAGNISMGMCLGFPSSSLYLQLRLDLALSCLPCEFALACFNCVYLSVKVVLGKLNSDNLFII